MQNNVYEAITDLDLLNIYRNDYILEEKIEESLYEEGLKNYYKYIRLVCELLDSLHLKNKIDYSIALAYLIDSGYLSLTESIDRNKSNYDVELKSHLGVNIVLGEGKCRHFADFHNDIMKRLGFDSRKYYCSGTPFWNNKKIYKQSADHVANVISHKDKMYVIDIFNHAYLYSFVSGNEAKRINDKDEYYLLYRPDVEYWFNEGDLASIKEQYELQEYSMVYPSISSKEYVDMNIDVLNKLVSQEDKISYFKNLTMAAKRDIAKSLKRVVK